MSGYKDGFKRGSNYNHRMVHADYDPQAELAAALTTQVTQDAKCAAGEHAERVAAPGRVTYMAFGKRVEPGTRYCRWCSRILPTREGSGA